MWEDAPMPKRLTYSNVTASIALFVALGGTSYAVTKLPRNSVGSTQVRDGSLQRKDLASGMSRGPRGVEGPQGPAGAAGQSGASSMLIAPATDGVRLSTAAGVQVQVRRMNDVPAGSWNLRFIGSPQLTGPIGLHVFCEVKVNGDVKARGGTVVGDGANATQESGLMLETGVVMAAPFNVTVDCAQNIPSDPATVLNRPQLVATSVSNVVVTP
jgi:hypothetical protein